MSYNAMIILIWNTEIGECLLNVVRKKNFLLLLLSKKFWCFWQCQFCALIYHSECFCPAWNALQVYQASYETCWISSILSKQSPLNFDLVGRVVRKQIHWVWYAWCGTKSEWLSHHWTQSDPDRWIFRGSACPDL